MSFILPSNDKMSFKRQLLEGISRDVIPAAGRTIQSMVETHKQRKEADS